MKLSTSVQRAVLLTSLICLFGIPGAIAEDSSGEKQVNTGQDPTKPLTRLDIRFQATNPPNTGDDVNALILRADAPVLLDKGKGGVLYTRIDVPTISRTDNDGDGDSGLGSVYTQALHIVPKTWAHPIGIDAWAPVLSPRFSSSKTVPATTVWMTSSRSTSRC